MFPIPWNFPFKKKDGTLTSLDDAISSGGGSYELPTASAETKGGVKIGNGLSMDGEQLNNTNPTPYTLPTASAETKGGVKIGNGLSMDGEQLNNSNPTPYTLPTASAETKGGVKVGKSLSIANDVLDLKLSEHACTLNTDNVTDASYLNVYRLKDNIYMIAGKVVLKNDLAVGSRINIGTLPSGIAPTSGESYIPNFVQATDYGVSAFVPATVPVYANGNIFVNNNVASITLRTVWVNFVIQMGDIPD